MANEKNVDNPVAKQSPEVEAMQADWALVDALMEGTSGMRARGERYLPKRPLEETTDHNHRLATATLYPAFSETIASHTGRVFMESPVVDESVPAWIREDVFKNIDKQGRDFNTFADNWFAEALRYGMSLSLIDAPAVQARTIEEQKKLDLKPYVIQINPKRLLGWLADADGVLLQVRIIFDEKVRAADGFSEEVVQTIRVYEPQQVRVFVKNKKTGKYEEDPARTRANAMGEVPLVVAYTNRTGLLQAKPPLLELAHLNVKHWQQQSSMDSLLEVASVPILAMSGVDEADEIVIGAKHAVKLPKGSEMKYVEHTGAAIDAGKDALAELKEEMRQAGAKLLMPMGQANKTATESREDTSRENSKLGGIVRLYENSLNAVIAMLGKTRNEEVKDDVTKLQPNLAPDNMPNETMKTLVSMRNSSILSDQTVFEEAQARGLLSKERTWEEEQQRIQDSMPVMPKPGLPGQPVPGQEEEEEEELDENGNPVKKPAAKPVPPQE